jgi:enoyl-CoA hydratase
MRQNPGNYDIVNCDTSIISAVNGEAMGSGLATALLADLTGEVAEHIGLVNLAVPPSNVLDTSLGIAQRMAAGPQHAPRRTKRSFNHWLRTAVPPSRQ